MLLGTAGYGAGALLDQFMPEKHFSRRGWRQSLGLLGAGLGAAPGIWTGMRNEGGMLAKYPWHNPDGDPPRQPGMQGGWPEQGNPLAADYSKVAALGEYLVTIDRPKGLRSCSRRSRRR